MRGITIREELTEEWKERGVKQQKGKLCQKVTIKKEVMKNRS